MNDQARYHLMRRLWEPVRQGMDMDCLVRVSESYNNLDNGRMELLSLFTDIKARKTQCLSWMLSGKVRIMLQELCICSG